MPSVIPARPWPDILSFIGSLPWMPPFHRFIERIVRSRYAENLFAYTSMHTVVSAQTAEIQDGQERLLLEFDSDRNIVRLTLWEQGAPPLNRNREGWAREVPPDKAFETFERFLRRIGWVPDAGPRDS